MNFSHVGLRYLCGVEELADYLPEFPTCLKVWPAHSGFCTVEAELAADSPTVSLLMFSRSMWNHCGDAAALIATAKQGTLALTKLTTLKLASLPAQ